MFRRMTIVAKGDQVLFCVLARPTSELLVMNFQIRACAANLTSPTVTLQDGSMQVGVLRAIDPDWFGLRETAHDGLWLLRETSPAARDRET